MATSETGRIPNQDICEPNHIILWLDVTIGNPDEYKHLKRAFATNVDPRVKLPTPLTSRDIQNLLGANQPQTVFFEGVEILLQVFDEQDKCFEAFKQHSDKRIYFITSGQLGQKIVPEIFKDNPDAFNDPITHEPCPSIYVFCHNIKLNMPWAMEFIEYIQMFNFDSELLERLVRDIATYFLSRARRMMTEPNLQVETLQRLHWAKRLWHQYDKMLQQIPSDSFRPVKESTKMKEINDLIQQVEPTPVSLETFHQQMLEKFDNQGDDDDDKVAEESGS